MAVGSSSLKEHKGTERARTNQQGLSAAKVR